MLIKSPFVVCSACAVYSGINKGRAKDVSADKMAETAKGGMFTRDICTFQTEIVLLHHQ